MELNCENVREIFDDCLFQKNELVDGKPPGQIVDGKPAGFIEVEGLVNRFGFNPKKIEKHKESIRKLLDELPDNFKKASGGGWSFLKACVDKNGRQWGEHVNIEELLSLGIASEQASYLMPRDMWSALPGGVPYFVVN